MSNSHSAALFTILEASGVVHESIRIQGSGGIIRGNGAAERLRVAMDQATNGRDTGFYEPEPGHAFGFRANAASQWDERLVDLRGAKLVNAMESP